MWEQVYEAVHVTLLGIPSRNSSVVDLRNSGKKEPEKQKVNSEKLSGSIKQFKCDRIQFGLVCLQCEFTNTLH